MSTTVSEEQVTSHVPPHVPPCITDLEETDTEATVTEVTATKSPSSPKFKPASYAEAIFGDKIPVTVTAPAGETVIDPVVESSPTPTKGNIPKDSPPSNSRKPNRPKKPFQKRRNFKPNADYSHAYEQSLAWLVMECLLPPTDLDEMVENCRYVIDSKTRRPVRSIRVATFRTEGDDDNIDPNQRHVSRKERIEERQRKQRQDKKAHGQQVKPNPSAKKGTPKDDAPIKAVTPEATETTEAILTETNAPKFQFQKSRFFKSKAFRQKLLDYYKPMGYYVKIFSFQGGRRCAVEVSW